MSTNIIIAVIFAVVICLTYAIAYFHGSKKAGNIDNVVKEIDTLSPLLTPIVTYLESRLPEPAQSQAKKITEAISKAVTAAENGWKNGLLTPDSRKQYAEQAMEIALNELNIKPTDWMTNIISKAIDLAVGLFLPISKASATTGIPIATADAASIVTAAPVSETISSPVESAAATPAASADTTAVTQEAQTC